MSRTAVSKWEAGRGYPNIDSLKEIAKFFSITIDELLSGEEVLTIAQQESKHKENSIKTLVFGLLDVSVVMCLILPLFGQKSDNTIVSVGLLSLTQISSILKWIYFAVVSLIFASGVITLSIQNSNLAFWNKHKFSVSVLLNTIGVLVFIVSSNQVYISAFLFVLLAIKAVMLIKTR